MTGIKFAEPLFLYLLFAIPAMVAFYLMKQQSVTASVRMPGLQPFKNTGKTFRHYLRHILFALRMAAIALLIIVLARPQKTDKFQDVSTEGIDIVPEVCLPAISGLTGSLQQKTLQQNSSQADLTTGLAL
jgi:Ca-activated chloride channel family protein